MRIRGAEVLLCKEVRCTAGEWARNSQGEKSDDMLMRALDEWLGLQKTGEDQMLAEALVSMLLMKVSTSQGGRLDLSGSEASPDGELAKTWLDIHAQYRRLLPQLQKGKRKPGEHPAQALACTLMMRASAIKMRQKLSELRPWLRTWLHAELTRGAPAAPSPTDTA